MGGIQNGIIRFLALRNEGLQSYNANTISVQFVGYPGSQQLILWLPDSIYSGYTNYQLWRDGQLLESDQVSNKISGSVKFIWDTKFWLPGTYRLQIDHNSGLKHFLEFRKENEPGPEDKTAIYTTDVLSGLNFEKYLNESKQQKENKSRNSQTNEKKSFNRDDISIPSHMTEDEYFLREQALDILNGVYEKIFSTGTDDPKLEYLDQGRTGTIFLLTCGRKIPFYYEMGASPVQYYIEIPTVEKWEEITGIPLNKRRETLLFIAHQVKKDQAPSWRFEIAENAILYYRDI